MESIVLFFAENGLDFYGLLKAAGMILLGALLICGVLRFIFGKKTLLGSAVSSSIAIVFIYVAMALILTLTGRLQWLVTPLPFASFTDDAVSFFSFRGAAYTTIAAELLSMIILAFLVNLIDHWLSKGKKFFGWLLLRCVTVALGLLLHYAVTWLFHRYLPFGIATYAPIILLVILIVMLLTGALRFVVGAALVAVNPVIAGLYTFFFATLTGKQVTKAVLTTGILTGIILLLQDLGITGLSLVSAAMLVYVPFLLLLVLVWYVINRVF